MSNLIIDNYPLTKEWLADLVKKKIGVKPKVGSCGILDNADLGFMSMIRKVQLHFDAEQELKHPNLPKNVVIKIASCAKLGEGVGSVGVDVNKGNAAAIMELFMHNTECNYYNVFRKYTDLPMKVPVIYCAAKAGDAEAPVPVIVMEMFEDCTVHDLIDGFDKDQLFKIVDEIVNLHIFSLTTEEWRSVLPDSAMRDTVDLFEAMVKTIAENMAKSPGLEIISKYIEKTFDKDPSFMTKFSDEYLEGKRKSVLTHGDLWSPQILWDKDDNIAGIIDWQVGHQGSPMEDLHRILSTGTSVENRNKLTKPLLDHYFEKLSAGLEEKGVKMPWTREEVDEEYNHCFSYGASITIFSYGIWSSSPILQTDGKPDPARISESFARCQSYVEEAVQVLGVE